MRPRLRFTSRVARRAFDAIARALPTTFVRTLYGAASSGLCVAICLHRVGARADPRAGDPDAHVTHAQLEELVDLLRPEGSGGARLTITFDDGYLDAWRWVARRAPELRDVEILFFVCPEKLEARAGYRWDLAENRPRGPAYDASRDDVATLSIDAENLRADLRDVADDPDHALADLERCAALADLPNVALGNHTNCHFNLAALPREQAEEELRRACEAMARAFDEPRAHFAFPFGVKGAHFRDEHVEALRRRGASVLWTIDERPYRPSERRPGAVLPRFAFQGSREAKGLALWIAWKCARHRFSAEAS